MPLIDWLILLLPALIVFGVGWYTRRYVRGVADFLAAGRSAGRYLVCIGEGMAAMGLITAVGSFEMLYEAGTAINWWGQIATPVGLVLTLTGFVIYRYRQTRALTMAQFFEMRYSRRFRIFMGVTAWVAGVLNYGIFPAVGARFFIVFCRLPESFPLLGFDVSTYAFLMAVILAMALFFVLLGGQVQILVTDVVQGLICGVLFVIVAFTVLRLFSFEQMFTAMSHREPGKSLLNPFDTGSMKDFNLWYVMIGIAGFVYTYMSWQGTQGYNASAINPHEAKMGKVLANWRVFAQTLMFTLLGIGAITFLRHADFADGAARVGEQLSHLDNEQIRKQMTVPAAIGEFLPVGVKGCFAAIMLFLMVSTDTAYLHSWGAIFVQDVVLPLRRAPLHPKQHLALLRWSITGVALFAFAFGLLFRQVDYIFMFFDVTGAIFLGGSGAAIIGGLYWSRGTAAGAWAAMGVGSTLAVSGILLPQLLPDFPLNGRIVWGIAMTGAIVAYVVVSLLSCRSAYDMDRLLHRGRFAVKEDAVAAPEQAAPLRNWKRVLLGWDEHFTRGDKLLSGALFGWSMFFFAAFVVISVLNLFWRWSERAWWNWGLVSIWLAIIIGPITTVWFTWGGLRDLRVLFRRLRTRPADATDDGRVTDPAIKGQQSGFPVTMPVAEPPPVTEATAPQVGA